MRPQHETQSGPLTVPAPKTVCRNDAERVLARRHVRIMRRAARAGIYPVFVIGFEPVFEALSFRSGEAQSGEDEIEGVVARRYGSVAAAPDFHLVRRCLLQNHRRGNGIVRIRVNRHHAAHGSKP